MKAFVEPFRQLGIYEELAGKLKKNRGVLWLSGCVDSQKIHGAYALWQGYSRRLLITYSEQKAKEIYEDCRYFDREAVLYQAKDFGRYAMPNDEMPICFIVNTDNTGGNSGSPVFNAKGELIGTGFDRNYEGLTGDIAFRPSSQRAACVDIRYTLFIIDKYAGASHLIEEMTIK